MAFRIEEQYLDLEVYRLLTILEASPALAGFDGSESDKRRVDLLRHIFEFAEISRIVVSLAAMIRYNLDAYSVSDRGPSGAVLRRQVGSLIPDLENPEYQEPLDFREALNKVIHGTGVDPERTSATYDEAEPLTGRLVLYGDLRGKEWRAELDLREYAFSAFALNTS